MDSTTFEIVVYSLDFVVTWLLEISQTYLLTCIAQNVYSMLLKTFREAG